MYSKDLTHLKNLLEEHAKELMMYPHLTGDEREDFYKKILGDAVEARNLMRSGSNLRPIKFCKSCQYRSDTDPAHSVCVLSNMEIDRENDYCSRHEQKHETLCWSCENALCGCSWSRSYKPVEGWVASKNYISYTTRFDEINTESYNVIECPEYVRDKKPIQQEARVQRCKKAKK